MHEYIIQISISLIFVFIFQFNLLKQRLARWSEVHKREYPQSRSVVPPPESISISKFGKESEAIIMSDTCNGAQKTRNILGEKIVDAGGTVLYQDCHQHLRNVWFGQVEKELSKALKLVLEDSVDTIDPSLYVTTSPSNFYVAVYKE